jgi:DNA-binding response OmpR family regulator
MSADRPRRLLWADDEIDLLKPHILYLEARGYEVTGVTGGEDALALAAAEPFDAVLLDVRMPGLDGLTVLERLRRLRPGLPVVMVTRQEDEGSMETALGREAEFLTKPVNPSQVLAACKRLLESPRLRTASLTRDWTDDFRQLSARLEGTPGPADWGVVAEGLAAWNLRRDTGEQEGLAESLAALEDQAHGRLARQLVQDYPAWVADGRSWEERLVGDLERVLVDGPGSAPAAAGLVEAPNRPLLVTDLLARGILPLLAGHDRALLLVLDCLRYDQWLALEPLLETGSDLTIERTPVFSLLPTATPWSRNGLLSGRFPDEVAAAFPGLWEGDWEEAEGGGPNRHEPDLLAAALEAVRPLLPNALLGAFERVAAPGDAAGVLRRLGDAPPPGLSVVTVSFLDLLVHGQADSAVLQELAPDAAALRRLARTWFEGSPLRELVSATLARGIPVAVASDHGSLRVTEPVEVKADASASRGLRVKVGRNLVPSDDRRTHRVDDLAAWRLPPHRLTTTYLLATGEAFLVFAHDAAAHRRRFTGSFQHGGLSLWETVVPFVRLLPR